MFSPSDGFFEKSGPACRSPAFFCSRETQTHTQPPDHLPRPPHEMTEVLSDRPTTGSARATPPLPPPRPDPTRAKDEEGKNNKTQQIHTFFSPARPPSFLRLPAALPLGKPASPRIFPDRPLTLRTNLNPPPATPFFRLLPKGKARAREPPSAAARRPQQTESPFARFILRVEYPY